MTNMRYGFALITADYFKPLNNITATNFKSIEWK